MRSIHSTAADVIRLLAIVSVAICLIPDGAHFFELLNELALPPADYMRVQTIYAGWALFGLAVFATPVLTLGHTLMVWPQPTARWLSPLCFLSILAT